MRSKMMWIPCTALALGLLAACGMFRDEGTGTEYTARSSDRVPGAEATVEVEETARGTAMVEVDVENLPPAGRIDPGLQSYVVWFIEPDGSVRRAGTLEYDERSRSGELRATNASRRFEVRITAEPEHDVEAPGELDVARQAVSLDD